MTITVEALCNSAEAIASVPDAKTRARIGQILWNSGDGSMKWPKLGVANHLEPGVVFYQNMGPIDPATNKPKGLMLLLTKEAIDYMRPSFAGKPVVNGQHKDIDPAILEDGIVVNSFWDGETGKEMVAYFAWDQETKHEMVANVGVSCAYYPIDPDMTPGTWHNVKYDGKITKGEYEHLTVTRDPRYEDSRTKLLNDAKGGAPKMKNPIKLALEKAGLLNSVEVEGDSSHIDLGEGKKATLSELVKNFLKPKDPVLDATEALTNDKAEVTLPDGKKTTIGELKAAFKAANATKEEEGDEMKKKENESDEEWEKRKKGKAENAGGKKPIVNVADIPPALLEEAVGKVLANRFHEAAALRGGPGAGIEYIPPDSKEDALARGRDTFGMPETK